MIPLYPTLIIPIMLLLQSHLGIKKPSAMLTEGKQLIFKPLNILLFVGIVYLCYHLL